LAAATREKRLAALARWKVEVMWFKRNGHFAKNEISESEVSNEYSKNQTEFHPRVQG